MRGTHRGWRAALIASVMALVVVGPILTVSTPAFAEDTGFWYGADSAAPGPANGSAPYTMPSCGSSHAYGGYIGKIGGADLISSANPYNPNGYGPGFTNAWNGTWAADANANHFNYNKGVGAGGYWFMWGPETSLANGMTAYQWGYAQGVMAVADWQRWYANGTHRMPLHILWADVELGQHWSSDGSRNRQVLNGFMDEVSGAGDGLERGVYSTRYQWQQIMAGTADIPNVWEWTAQTSVSNSPTPCPNNFTNSNGNTALFFGGQNSSSPKALIWQWSQGTADYDQIDARKNPPDS